MAKRNSISVPQAWLIRVAAVLLALVINALLIYTITKMNPLQVYVSMFKGAFGSSRRIWNFIREGCMLLCISVALAPAFKMRFWNIGAEGQTLIGGLVIRIGDRVIDTSIKSRLEELRLQLMGISLEA